MTYRPTVQALIELLTEIASRAPEDAILSINGETVETFSVTVQNPLAKTRGSGGLVQLIRDPHRHEVLDISINGRVVPDLPRRDYGYDERIAVPASNIVDITCSPEPWGETPA